MNRGLLSVLAGLSVMVAGLVVFFDTQVDSEAPPVSPAPALVEEWAPPTSTAAATTGTPEIPGVPMAVAAVLLDSGAAEELGAEDLSGLDPVVARVLIAYGATLQVPIDDGGQAG